MSYSDLPDSVKKAIENLLDSLSGLTKEQIYDLLSDMLGGEDGLAELADMIDLSTDFSIEIDDEEFNMDQFLEELEEFGEYMYGLEEDIEPYYEIYHKENHQGEIIIEMPGLEGGVQMINFYVFDEELFIHSINSVEKYKLVIPIPAYYVLKEDQVVYRSGLFIIPFELQ